MTSPAITYCRISSLKQVTEGNGLDSQMSRCAEFSKYKGLEVVEVFRDEGVSGSLIERLSMQAMLRYLKIHSKRQTITVIIDDISRLARGLEAHMQLRSAINAAGGVLTSPSIEFGEDSDSILLENLLASVSQHARQKNTEQVVHRMRARTLSGYWCFYPPLGFKYKTVKGHGKLLVRHEPVASLIVEALEDFASSRFATIAEVKRFLEAQPAYPRSRNGEIHFQSVRDLLGQILYAGFIDVKKWGISLHPAKHKPLISFETWQKNQSRLNITPVLPARQDLSADFPLRDLVSCGCCDHPMTSSWWQGRNRKYAYYFCQTKGCEMFRKSIKKEQIEGDFEALLKSLHLVQGLFEVAREMLRDLWDHQKELSKEQIAASKAELTKLSRQCDRLVDKIIETDNQTMIIAFEAKIRKLDADKIVLSEKIKNCGRLSSASTKLIEPPCNSSQTPINYGIQARSKTAD
ncbi:MAG: recombinase [Rhodobacteraceae bacterium]|nr:recombinase [Paracoccaceae bacterium]